MAGQLFVRDVEIPDSTRNLRGEGTPFLELPFDEAIQAFTARGIVNPEVFYSNLDGIRQRSWTATHLMAGTVREHAFDLLQKAMRGEGMGDPEGSALPNTFEEFAEAIRAEEVRLGISPSSQGYLRTVFDTNVAANYGAGRFQQLTDPDVIEARPFVEYRATLDSHTRPDHEALHGMAWPADSSEWHNVAPPNDFNCRCVLISREEVSEEQLAKAREAVLDDVPHWSFSGPPDALLRLDEERA